MDFHFYRVRKQVQPDIKISSWLLNDFRSTNNKWLSSIHIRHTSASCIQCDTRENIAHKHRRSKVTRQTMLSVLRRECILKQRHQACAHAFIDEKSDDAHRIQRKRASKVLSGERDDLWMDEAAIVTTAIVESRKKTITTKSKRCLAHALCRAQRHHPQPRSPWMIALRVNIMPYLYHKSSVPIRPQSLFCQPCYL